MNELQEKLLFELVETVKALAARIDALEERTEKIREVVMELEDCM